MKFSFRTASTDLQSMTPGCSALAGVQRKLAVYVNASNLPYKIIGQALFSV